VPGLSELRRRVDAITEAADSFRVRAFFTGEKEIVEAGKFSKGEYERYLDYLLEDEFRRRLVLGVIREGEGLTIEEIAHRTGFSKLEVARHVNALRYEELVECKDDGLVITRKEEQRKVPYEKIKFIVEEGLCTGCGGCIAACPVYAITFIDEKPVIDEGKCIGCGICNIHCPRTFFPISMIRESLKGSPVNVETEGVSFFRQAYTAQTAKEKVKQVCQDGGIVTSILAYLFDKGMIDCAIGVRKADEYWRTQATLVTNLEELLGIAGTKYTVTPSVSLLEEVKRRGFRRVAVVGVPCQIHTVRKAEAYSSELLSSLGEIVALIGIFCMENFGYIALREIVENRLGVKLEDVAKFNIDKGKFFAHTKNGEERSIPVKEISMLARHACHYCPDLTNELADISVGSIGSSKGWSTVLVRTKRGEEIFEGALREGYVTANPLPDASMELLQKLAKGKRKRNLEALSERAREGKYATLVI